MKKIIRFLIFAMAFLFILDKLTLLFVRKGNGYGTDVLNFYAQEKNSIDILFLGSSHAYSSFNPYVIEDETGLNGYVFATQQQPIWITYYYLKEALKYQKPKYVVLEVHMITIDDEYSSESVNRDALDKMKLSINKIDAIRHSIKDFSERFSYYFNIIKYHDRWKSLNSIDVATVFKNYTVDNKGYIALPKTDFHFVFKEINEIEVKKISIKNEQYLYKIIKLLDDKNIELILVKTPALYDENAIKKLNYVENLAYADNLSFINYIKNMESLDIDYYNDFYDEGHLNINGSIKLSKKFGEYLNQKNLARNISNYWR